MSSRALSLGHQNERFEPEAFRHADSEKVIPGGIRRGYCLLEGPARLVAPLPPAMKDMQPSPGSSRMSDFLEAVLREMASRLCSQWPLGRHLTRVPLMTLD